MMNEKKYAEQMSSLAQDQVSASQCSNQNILNQSNIGVCPSCGRCPNCGRSNFAPYPYWPYYPYWTYPYITYEVTSTSGYVQTTGNIYNQGSLQ